MREKYFASVVKQDLDWFTKHPSGELTSRISSDVNQMNDGMGEKVDKSDTQSFNVFYFLLSIDI